MSKVLRAFAVSVMALFISAVAAGQAAPTPSLPSLSLNDQLLAAATNGDAAAAGELLQKGANIEAKDNLGWTPLIWAAYQGRTDVVTLLLEKGANIEAKGNAGQTRAAMKQAIWVTPMW